MDDVSDRSSIPPPLPPKTRKNINNTGLSSNNQVVSATVTPPSTKTTVFGGVQTDDATVTPPTELAHHEQHEMFSFSFPEVRSLNLLSGQTRLQTSSSSPHSITNGDHHVVKIRINPGDDAISTSQYPSIVQQYPSLCGKPPVPSINKGDTQSLTFHQSHYTSTPTEGCIRINVSSSDVEHQHQNEDMVRRTTTASTTSSSAPSIPNNFIKTSTPERSNPYFFYGPFPSNGMVISSGQSSPSDTLDSGTCSDLDGSTPPPLPKKKSAAVTTATVTVTVNGGGHRRTGSLTSSGAEVDSDDDGSNISCDSLNSSDLITNGPSAVVDQQENKELEEEVQLNQHVVKEDNHITEKTKIIKQIPPTPPSIRKNIITPPHGHFLPQGLLQDIRERSAKLSIVPSPCNTLSRKTRTWADDKNPIKPIEVKNGTETNGVKLNGSIFKQQDLSPTSTLKFSNDDQSKKSTIVEEKTYEDRKKETAEKHNGHSNKIVNNGQTYDTDRFYTFHLNESVIENKDTVQKKEDDDETFAGYKDLLQDKESSSTIRSAKGTVRGVKNRVRAGIATFLQLHATKNYKKEEAGKVVVYTTTMGVVRDTYQDCVFVKKILRNLMVKYEERDVFMSRDTQTEIRERMGCDVIVVPQVFVEGQHIGNAETVEKLNESGEFRRILKPFKSADACSTCRVCGGHRLLPCTVCNGSKKSVHRNDFTAEFVALKCMHCDEVGLVRCHAC